MPDRLGVDPRIQLGRYLSRSENTVQGAVRSLLDDIEGTLTIEHLSQLIEHRQLSAPLFVQQAQNVVSNWVDDDLHKILVGASRTGSSSIEAAVTLEYDWRREDMAVDVRPIRKWRPNYAIITKQDDPWPAQGGVLRFLDEHESFLRRHFGQQAGENLAEILRVAARNGEWAAGGVARDLRGLVKLTPREAARLAQRYEMDRRAGLSARDARKRLKDKEAELIEARIQRIAQHEVAQMWNVGTLESVKERVRNGEIESSVKKVWLTVDDEYVCPICRPLHNKVLSLNKDFKSGSFRGQSPPGHIGCRCALAYARKRQHIQVDTSDFAPPPEEPDEGAGGMEAAGLAFTGLGFAAIAGLNALTPNAPGSFPGGGGRKRIRPGDGGEGPVRPRAAVAWDRVGENELYTEADRFIPWAPLPRNLPIEAIEEFIGDRGEFMLASDKLTSEPFPLSKLWSSQHIVEPPQIRRMLQGDDLSREIASQPIVIVQTNRGHWIIIDGHHRASAAKIRGDKTIDAFVIRDRIVDVDAEKPEIVPKPTKEPIGPPPPPPGAPLWERLDYAHKDVDIAAYLARLEDMEWSEELEELHTSFLSSLEEGMSAKRIKRLLDEHEARLEDVLNPGPHAAAMRLGNSLAEDDTIWMDELGILPANRGVVQVTDKVTEQVIRQEPEMVPLSAVRRGNDGQEGVSWERVTDYIHGRAEPLTDEVYPLTARGLDGPVIGLDESRLPVDMPSFFLHEGQYIIMEGHHRVAAAVLRGENMIQGRVIMSAAEEAVQDVMRRIRGFAPQGGAIVPDTYFPRVADLDRWRDLTPHSSRQLWLANIEDRKVRRVMPEVIQVGDIDPVDLDDLEDIIRRGLGSQRPSDRPIPVVIQLRTEPTTYAILTGTDELLASAAAGLRQLPVRVVPDVKLPITPSTVAAQWDEVLDILSRPKVAPKVTDEVTERLEQILGTGPPVFTDDQLRRATRFLAQELDDADIRRIADEMYAGREIAGIPLRASPNDPDFKRFDEEGWPGSEWGGKPFKRDEDVKKWWEREFGDEFTPKDMLDHMLLDALPDGVTEAEVELRRFVALPNGRGVRFGVVLYGRDPQGNRGMVYGFTRTIRIGPMGGSRSVSHDTFSIRESLQGQNTGKQLLANMVSVWERMDLDRVDILANIDIGSYAWAKYGFVPDEWRTFAEYELLRKLNWNKDEYIKKFGINEFDYVKDMLEDLDGQPSWIWDLADRPIGKALLMNMEWNGELNLKDKLAMSIFRNYVRRGDITEKPFAPGVPRPGSVPAVARDAFYEKVPHRRPPEGWDSEPWSNYSRVTLVQGAEKLDTHQVDLGALLPKLARTETEIELENLRSITGDIEEPVVLFIPPNRDGTYYILEGHHRIAHALATGQQTVPAKIVGRRGAQGAVPEVPGRPQLSDSETPPQRGQTVQPADIATLDRAALRELLDESNEFPDPVMDHPPWLRADDLPSEPTPILPTETLAPNTAVETLADIVDTTIPKPHTRAVHQYDLSGLEETYTHADLQALSNVVYEAARGVLQQLVQQRLLHPLDAALMWADPPFTARGDLLIELDGSLQWLGNLILRLPEEVPVGSVLRTAAARLRVSRAGHGVPDPDPSRPRPPAAAPGNDKVSRAYDSIFRDDLDLMDSERVEEVMDLLLIEPLSASDLGFLEQHFEEWLEDRGFDAVQFTDTYRNALRGIFLWRLQEEGKA